MNDTIFPAKYKHTLKEFVDSLDVNLSFEYKTNTVASFMIHVKGFNGPLFYYYVQFVGQDEFMCSAIHFTEGFPLVTRTSTGMEFKDFKIHQVKSDIVLWIKEHAEPYARDRIESTEWERFEKSQHLKDIFQYDPVEQVLTDQQVKQFRIMLDIFKEKFDAFPELNVSKEKTTELIIKIHHEIELKQSKSEPVTNWNIYLWGSGLVVNSLFELTPENWLNLFKLFKETTIQYAPFLIP